MIVEDALSHMNFRAVGLMSPQQKLSGTGQAGAGLYNTYKDHTKKVPARYKCATATIALRNKNFMDYLLNDNKTSIVDLDVNGRTEAVFNALKSMPHGAERRTDGQLDRW